MRRGLDGFSDDVRAWRAVTPGRAAVYHQLLEHAASLFEAPEGAVEESARARVEAAWRERKLTSPYHRPLLLMAALRAEALRAGSRHPLAAAIAARDVRSPGNPRTVPGPSRDDSAGQSPAPATRRVAATRPALAAALSDATPRQFADLATRTVQTNETSRAVTWLWPAALAGATRALALYDLGCSAGLNLSADRLPAIWTDPQGAPLPVSAPATVVARHGFDASPLDVARDADRLWLAACVWPGELARQERLSAAIDAFRELAAGPAAPRLETGDLGEVPSRLQALAAVAPDGVLHLAYQTVVRDYLPPATRTRYTEGMHAWVAAATPGSPRVWLELEAPPQAASMTIDAHLARDGDVQRLTLARCGYHPDVVTPDADAVAAFCRAVAG